MRTYTIKRTGKSTWYNMMLDREITFPNGDIIYAGLFFFRKKDAKKYLETFKYKEYFEVVGVTVDKCKKDNRVND